MGKNWVAQPHNQKLTTQLQNGWELHRIIFITGNPGFKNSNSKTKSRIMTKFLLVKKLRRSGKDNKIARLLKTNVKTICMFCFVSCKTRNHPQPSQTTYKPSTNK